jgi:hypothetical protein
MDTGLALTGVLCVALAIGHATIGLVWVLPAVTNEHLPKTPFGSPAMSAAMIHATWHIVTVFVFALATLLLMLAWDADADPKTLLLRVFAGMWLAATAVALWVAGRRLRSPRDLLRLPVPAVFVIVAVLLWTASV